MRGRIEINVGAGTLHQLVTWCPGPSAEIFSSCGARSVGAKLSLGLLDFAYKKAKNKSL